MCLSLYSLEGVHHVLPHSKRHLDSFKIPDKGYLSGPGLEYSGAPLYREFAAAAAALQKAPEFFSEVDEERLRGKEYSSVFTAPSQRLLVPVASLLSQTVPQGPCDISEAGACF